MLEDAADRERFWATVHPEPGQLDAEGLRPVPLIVVALSHKQAYLDRYTRPDKGWTDRDEARWPAPYWTSTLASRRCSCCSRLWMSPVTNMGPPGGGLARN